MDQFSNHPFYRKHTLDSVMSSFWEFYKKHFLVLFLSSFVVSLGIQFLSSAIDITGIQSSTDPYEIYNKMKVFIWPLTGISVISIIFGVILNYYIVYNPVDDSINIFNSIYKSLKYLLPYIIILILFTFFAATALLLGLLLLVIGVFFSLLYVMTLFLFILPVLMAERNNIGHSISRTFILGHRNFWSNLGWVGVFTIIIIVFSLVSSAIVLIPFSGSFLKIFTNPAEATNMLKFTTSPVYITLSALVNALYLPVFSILGVILYFNGKAREEVVPEVVTPSEPEKVRVEDLYAKPYSDDHPENPENK